MNQAVCRRDVRVTRGEKTRLDWYYVCCQMCYIIEVGKRVKRLLNIGKINRIKTDPTIVRGAIKGRRGLP
jgi:hypothetical protein